jgi:hypothetical protein
MLGYDAVPFCYFNLCGAYSVGPQLEPQLPGNGEPFGPCSATLGYLGPDAPLDGTCHPFGTDDANLVGGVCQKGGAAAKRTACRPDADKDEPSWLCVTDAFCLGIPADEPAQGCATDAACPAVPVTAGGTTALYAGYCAKDGTCQPLGFCADTCNAGTAGPAVEPNAGCDPPGRCVPLGDPAGDAVAVGYCEPL